MIIDLTIVSGARPKLLENTLSSLSKYILPTFEVSHVFANIDKFGGGEPEAIECKLIILHYFPNSTIFMSDKNDFTAAVKKLWQLPVSDYVLHIEDDWEFLENIKSEEIESLFVGRTRQVTLDNSDKHRPIFWKNHNKTLFSFWKISIPDYRRPIFTTSPSFINSKFAREVANRMKLDFDPEKQLYSDANMELSNFTRPFRNSFVSPRKGFYIRDTGRAWRDDHGVRKSFIHGKSVWKSQE